MVISDGKQHLAAKLLTHHSQMYELIREQTFDFGKQLAHDKVRLDPEQCNHVRLRNHNAAHKHLEQF